jgi:hypothetical protein
MWAPLPCLHVGEIRVYEHVYEYGVNPSEDMLPTYSYTYSYSQIS